MRLTVTVIGILSQDDHLDPVERGEVEGCEILRSLRKDLLAGIELGVEEGS